MIYYYHSYLTSDNRSCILKNTMDSRKQKLLQYIIEVYIKTAQPVGSTLISEKYMKDVSGPTVRNWMQELEREGYITHPHTSAGRVPTEAGYRYYIEHGAAKDITEKNQKEIDQAHSASKNVSENVKSMAKKAADVSHNVIVVAFSPHDVYYTGLSNLFSHPEFSNQDVVVHMSEMIDHLDEVMSSISKQLDRDIAILIGSDNPFGIECGSVFSLLDDGVVIGILGPMRMDYSQNVGLVKYIKFLLEE